MRLRNFSSVTATGSCRLMLSVISSLEQRAVARPDRTNKKIKLCRRYFILSIDSVTLGSITRGTFHRAVDETVGIVLFFGSFAPPSRREVFIRTEERLFGKMIYDTDIGKWHESFARFRNRRPKLRVRGKRQKNRE